MSGYCRTINERNGQKYFGIDFVADDGETVLVNAIDITCDWNRICRMVRWLNEIEFSPILFESFITFVKSEYNKKKQHSVNIENA